MIKKEEILIKKDISESILQDLIKEAVIEFINFNK